MCENNKFACIDGFAEELDELVYEGLSNWFISFRSVTAVYAAHFSYLFVFCAVVACGVLSFKHARDSGGKLFQFWWGAMVHGIVSESGLSSAKYWHAQAPVMFFGKHLPLHIVFYYPSLLYMASAATQKLNLRVHSEAAVAGLIVMMLEIPFRILSVKFLHITYHDTDPSYASKLYGVPWIEIVSSLVFSSSYVILFHGLKQYFLPEDYERWGPCVCDRRESMLNALAGFLGSLGGVIQRILFFHILHDSLRVSPATCLLFLISIYLAVALCDQSVEEQSEPEANTPAGKRLLLYQLCIYLFGLLFLALLGKPQHEIAIGKHEPTGDCTTMICSRTSLGKALKRRKYLCAEEVGERSHFVYNFNCVPNGAPCLNAIWYTICGTAIRNRFDFFAVIFSFNLVIIAFYMKTLFHDTLRSTTERWPDSNNEDATSGTNKRKAVNFIDAMPETSQS